MPRARDTARRRRSTGEQAEAPAPGDDRRASVLRAASEIFSRYGFRKASMEDVAGAAGLSRQGLYLRFPTKEDLFRATVLWLLETTQAQAQAALTDDKLPIGERVAGALDAMHGQFVTAQAGGNLDELLETSVQLVGPVQEQHERAFREALTTALRRARVALPAGVTLRALVETLEATAVGLKHRHTDQAAWRESMRAAVALCLTPR